MGQMGQMGQLGYHGKGPLLTPLGFAIIRPNLILRKSLRLLGPLGLLGLRVMILDATNSGLKVPRVPT